jgi:hypothetical protein
MTGFFTEYFPAECAGRSDPGKAFGKRFRKRGRFLLIREIKPDCNLPEVYIIMQLRLNAKKQGGIHP